MISKLTTKTCVPCKGGTPPFTEKEIAEHLALLQGTWTVVASRQLEKEFLFPDFKHALDCTIAIGNLAEQERHHPDITLSWGKVKVLIWTHKINGLSENDFILAAKIDQIIN